jgi:hypothetical protein
MLAADARRARSRADREGMHRARGSVSGAGDRAMLLLLLLLLLLLHTPCVLSGSVEPAGPTAKLTLYHEFQPRFEHLGLANQDTGNATDDVTDTHRGRRQTRTCCQHLAD